MAEDMGDKTEEPTARRLSDAREKGQIARSIDLSGAVDMIGAAVVIYLFATTLRTGLAEVMAQLLAGGGPVDVLDQDGAVHLFLWAIVKAAISAWPIAAIMFAIILVAQLQQTGFMITTKPLEPDLSKLNIFTGFGKIFNKKGLVKTLVSTVKLTIITTVVVIFVIKHMREIACLPALSLHAAIGVMFALVVKIMTWVLGIMLAIGAADYLYQRFDFVKGLKMTKTEVKDERKMSEGDLEMKAKRMSMGREMITQRLKGAVPTADVIVTNPTHYAVALKYDTSKGAAPLVIAKGADYVALRIREIAGASGVPIVEKPTLARALYNTVPVGREVPTQYYEAVAEILAYVYRINGRAEEAQREAMLAANS